MKPPSKRNHPLLSDESPWRKNSHSIWLGSTLSLTRNLEKYKFPGKLSTQKRKQVIALLSRQLIASENLKEPKLIPAEELSPVQKEFFVEHFLSSQGFHQAFAGEGFMIDRSGEFLATLNMRDHLFLQYIDPGEELEKTWDRLVKVELGLKQAANFAFSPRFGFLTSDPTRCGTAFQLNVFLHLPALIYSNTLNDILEKNKDEAVEQTGLQGDPNEMIGDIVVFHNRYTLGVAEETILASLRTLATKMVAEERSMRHHIKQETEVELAEVKDKVSRAFAILLHSYQIESIEALNSLSLIKLGLDLKWIKGASQATLNELLFSCRRGHLLCHYGEEISQEELPHKRAEYIHQALHGLELLI